MFTGVDGVVFGAEDLESCKRFLVDWGLTDSGSNDSRLRFVTRDRSEVVICKPDDASLSAPNFPPPALREVIWGVTDEAALAAVTQRLGAEAITNPQGLASIRDVDGFTHSFRVTQRTHMAAVEQHLNAPGAVNRVDQRSPVYREASPLGIGHVVIWSSDYEAAANFYKEKFGFVESDRFIDFGIFLRATTPGPHHHLFIQSNAGRWAGHSGADHVSFTVNGSLEVLGGGLAMGRKGWPTWLGPGFHPVSSAFYWYFQTPFGPRFEYYVDDDYCTEEWKPQSFVLTPQMYVEWAVNGFHRNHA